MRREFDAKQRREEARKHLVEGGQLTTEQLRKMGDTSAAQKQAETVEANRDNTLEILAERKRKSAKQNQQTQQTSSFEKGSFPSVPHPTTSASQEANMAETGNTVQPQQRTQSYTQGETWLPAVDPISQQTYFWNRMTREATWYDPRISQENSQQSETEQVQAPGDFTPEEEAQARSRSFAPDTDAVRIHDVDQLPHGWLASVQTATKKVYYFNYITGSSQWERPKE